MKESKTIQKGTPIIYYTLYIMGVCLWLLTLVGCTPSSSPNAVEEPEGITFTSSADAVESSTRALVNNEEGLRNQSFSVFGYKMMESGIQIFNNQAVVYNGGWAYSPIKYWDAACYYTFGAYSPHLDESSYNGSPYVSHSVVGSGNNEQHAYTIHEMPQWQPVDGNEQDFMVADAEGPATQFLGNAGKVQLNFKHLLAQVEVRAYKKSSASLADLTYTITKVTMGGTLNGNTLNVPTANRTYTHNYTNQTANFSAAVCDGTEVVYNSAAGTVIEMDPTQTSVCSFLAAPFTMTQGSIPLTVEYYIKGPSSAAVGQPAACVLTGISEFKSNCKYIITLKFDAGQNVVASVLEVQDWKEESKAQEVYNW